MGNIGNAERARRAALFDLGLKRCSRCEQELPLDSFAANRSLAHGRHGVCKACVMQRRADSGSTRTYYMKARHGITVEVYEEMRERQMGRCAICLEDLVRGPAEHLDHDHSTGIVREILCRPCNQALGYAKDDPDRLRGLLAYLEKHGRS